MVTFTYIIEENYIQWKAAWDGKYDNDPLLKEDPMNVPPHPFCTTLDFKPDDSGPLVVADIVALNPATLALCKMLSDDKSISDGSGHTHPYEYRISLLGVISRLWD